MDKLLDSATGEAAKESRAVAMTSYELESPYLVVSVEEKLNAFTIDTNKEFPATKISFLSGPTHHEHFVSHRSFHWLHFKTLKILNYVSPFCRKCL